MSDAARSVSLLLVLLNPFLVIIYLIDLVEKLERPRFARVILRAAAIAGTVFCCFALLGDAIFSNILQAEFASFQIFGGLVFLLIGVQFVLRGATTLELLRGESEHLAGAVAMPVLIGPGTVSASIVIGRRHDPLSACLIVLVAVITSAGLVLLLKAVHDFVRPRNANLVSRYVEISGRIAALYVGTVAVDMIMQGIGAWIRRVLALDRLRGVSARSVRGTGQAEGLPAGPWPQKSRNRGRT
jgi:small neutral amino acid transporter SnatA (MarC family)